MDQQYEMAYGESNGHQWRFYGVTMGATAPCESSASLCPPLWNRLQGSKVA